MTNSTFLGKALCASWIKGPYLDAAKGLIESLKMSWEHKRTHRNTIENPATLTTSWWVEVKHTSGNAAGQYHLIFLANDRVISIGGGWLLVNVSRNYGKYRVPHTHQTSKTKGLFLDKIPKNLCFWLALPKALFSWVDAIKLSILANASCQEQSKRRIAIDLPRQPNEPNINKMSSLHRTLGPHKPQDWLRWHEYA